MNPQVHRFDCVACGAKLEVHFNLVAGMFAKDQLTKCPCCGDVIEHGLTGFLGTVIRVDVVKPSPKSKEAERN
jgi:NAD-dependent SIR2 family protein deacetylase